MKAVTGWNFRPYAELYKPERGLAPYICRLTSQAGGFSVDFIDNSAAGDIGHIVYFRKRGTEYFIAAHPEKADGIYTARIQCEDLTDYEDFAERSDCIRSSVRLVRTGYVPGTVINYLHPDDEEYAFSGHYLCSPSIIKLKSGRLLASMDVFAGNSPQNLTLIYRSDDDGESWTMPTILFRGASFSQECGLHRAPMPVEISHGRVRTDVQYGAWAKHIMCDAVMSAPEESDLLDPDNWVCSEFFNPQKHFDVMLPGVIGGIEGNIVTAPDGTVYNILRYTDGKSLMLKFNPEEPEHELEFAGYIDFPAATSKVDIVYDKKSGVYVSLVSYNLSESNTLRNLLSLIYSADLRKWKLAKHIIDYRDADRQKIAFQYIDFFIDGDDILFQSRTAFNGAKNFHDNNYSTFHRIPDFRSLLMRGCA